MCGPLNTTLVNGYMNHDSHTVDVSKHHILVKCYLWPVLKNILRKHILSLCINLFFLYQFGNIQW